MFKQILAVACVAIALCFASQSADAGGGNFVSGKFRNTHVFNGFGNHIHGFHYNNYVPQVLVFPVGYGASGYGGVGGYGTCGVSGFGGYGVGASPYVAGFGFGYSSFSSVRFVRDRFGRVFQVRGFGGY